MALLETFRETLGIKSGLTLSPETDTVEYTASRCYHHYPLCLKHGQSDTSTTSHETCQAPNLSVYRKK